jgi:hypothetical protein
MDALWRTVTEGLSTDRRKELNMLALSSSSYSPLSAVLSSL